MFTTPSFTIIDYNIITGIYFTPPAQPGQVSYQHKNGARTQPGMTQPGNPQPGRTQPGKTQPGRPTTRKRINPEEI